MMSINNNWINEYPRPMLKRDSYYSLNGEWTLNNNKIIVPFPPQSKLSQYNEDVKEQLHYHKTFSLPADFYKDNDNVILHFGAVDQTCEVYINDVLLGSNEGGYLPFHFNITEHLKAENELIVKVVDTLTHDYPYGKQRKDRGGMWYTPVSGIWQSVWLEAVPHNSIDQIKVTPTLHSVHLDIDTNASEYTITIPLKTKVFKETYTSKSIDIIFDKEDIDLWSPENPHLYHFTIDTEHDHIESYFALREIKIEGKNLYLNNKKIFLHGVLDQGYYQDGIFLPESPKEYENDVLRMKELGLNFLRKHIKIEPETFYYACDKHGMLVMQDMVNNGGYNYIFDTVLPNIGLVYRKDKDRLTPRQREIFEDYMRKTLKHLYNHPCIISYTIFNEGWGQFNSDDMYDICKSLDTTRFYDSTSGWFHQKKNDVDSLHVYFKTKPLKTKMNKPIFLSECGGYTRLIENHVFNKDATYGYGTTHSEDELMDKIEKLYKEMVYSSIPNGLCGCVYTQLSDVEDEINGLYTYDRQVCKVNKERMLKIKEKIESLL